MKIETDKTIKLSKRTQDIKESFLNKWDSIVKNKILEGENILQFNLGQPDFSCPDFIKAIISDVNLESGNNYYNHTAGTKRARGAVCAFQKGISGMDYLVDEAIITNGAKEALYLAFGAILDPEDEAIILAPYWPTYVEAVKLHGGVPVIVDCNKDFHPDMKALSDAITDKTKAIVVNSPNNPSGSVYDKSELQAIADLAIDNDLLVISDEVYGSTVFDGIKHFSIAALEGMKERTVVVDGFSKALSMAGYRVGYALSSKEIIGAMNKLKSNVNGNSNSFFQAVLEKAILDYHGEMEAFMEHTLIEYSARRDLVCQYLDDMEIEHTEAEGTFYIFARIPERLGINSEKFAEILLDKTGVAVAPGIFFGKAYDDYFRISFSASLENIREGMERLKKILQ